MRCPAILALFLATSCLFSHRELNAQAPMRGDPDRLLCFAHHLRERGDLYRAEGEYMAFLSLFPHHSKAPEAWLSLGRTRQSMQNWDGALEAFFSAMSKADPHLAIEARWAAADTLLGSGKPLEAAQILHELARDPFLGNLRSKALLSSAKALLAAREWEKAKEFLLEISPAQPEAQEASELLIRLETDPPWLPRRNEWLAGGLSALVPGAGHLYVGKPWEALTSFLLNLAFLAGSVWSVKEGCLISSGIFSFLELGWYLGGIQSAAEAARTYNEEQERRWIREIGQVPMPGADCRSHNGVSFRVPGLQWRF